MMRVIHIFFLIILFVFNFEAFAQIDNNAYVTYESSLAEKTTGIYPKGSFVFFIADIEMESKRVKKAVYEGRAMLKVKELIKKYFAAGIHINSSDLDGCEGPIREKINELIAADNFYDFSMKDLRGRVLVNQSFKKNGQRYYRYVYAVTNAKLHKKKKELSSVEINAPYLIRMVFNQAKEEEKYKELVSYYLEMGLWEDIIFFQKKILSEKFNLVSYYHSLNPIGERKYLRKLLLDTKKIADPASILLTLPGNLDALNVLIDKKSNQNSLDKIIFQLTRLPAVPKADLDDAYNALNQQLQSIGSSTGLKEYIQVLKNIQTESRKQYFKNDIIIHHSFLALGHLEIDPSLGESENEFFLSARQLFNQRADKKEICNLLVQSIKTSPRHADSWNYLGALMTAENRLLEAVVLHTQAYHIDNSNLETMANIADCYWRLGKKNLAANYAAYMEILNEKSNNRFVNKIIFKIKERR